MTAIREYLETRRTKLKSEMQPIEATAAELRAQLSAHDAKLRIMSKELADVEKALQALGKREPSESTVTIKDAILQALAGAPNGMTSAEILAAINDRFFEGTIVRTSMSPQLARLKNDDHKIRQRGDRYFLA
jgi:septal ring factor EnvC (AmiA/AmiB activator)